MGDIVAPSLGDASPNTSGPRCKDTGLPCDGSCDRQSGTFIAYGPRSDMVHSTEIIGIRQFDLYLKTRIFKCY